MTERRETSHADFVRITQVLTDLINWSSLGVVLDGLSDIAKQQSMSQGKALYELGEALAQARQHSGLPGYYHD